MVKFAQEIVLLHLEKRIKFSQAFIFQLCLSFLRINILESLETYLLENVCTSNKVWWHSLHSLSEKYSPKKASMIPVALFRLPDTRKHRMSPVWSGLIQSHAGPPCSGGQGHPSATSTCQRRLAGEGLWCDAGDRLKGDTNRDLECQSAKRRGIPHF